MSAPHVLGRELNDAELESFHGGSTCEITFIRNGLGQISGVRTTGDCQNVVINVSIQQS